MNATPPTAPAMAAVLPFEAEPLLGGPVSDTAALPAGASAVAVRLAPLLARAAARAMAIPASGASALTNAAAPALDSCAASALCSGTPPERAVAAHCEYSASTATSLSTLLGGRTSRIASVKFAPTSMHAPVGKVAALSDAAGASGLQGVCDCCSKRMPPPLLVLLLLLVI